MEIINTNNRKWWILFATALMMFVLNLDVTAVNLAIAAISRSLATSLLTAQWIINGFVIACSALTVISGRLGDIFGYRRIFLIGTVIFLIACLGVGLAQNAWTIISMRVLQGAGMALCFPIIYAINFSVFPIKQRGIALGILTAGIGLAQACGPTLGGLFIEILSWRWIFFMQVPIALTSIILIALTYHDPIAIKQKQSVDYIGCLLLISGLFILTLSLNEAQRWGITSPIFLSSLTLSIILLIAFTLVELRITAPIVNIRLFTNYTFTLVSIIRISYSFVFFSLLFFISIFLQNIAGYSASKSGILLLFMTIIFGLVSPFSGKWIDKSGTRIPLATGMLLLAIGFLFFAHLTIHTNQIKLLYGLLCVGIASGILLPSTSIAAISTVKTSVRGAASGLFYTNSFLGGALGIAISGYIIATLSYHYLRNELAASPYANLPIPKSVIMSTASGLHPTSSLLKYTDIQTFSRLELLISRSFTHAFSTVMWICVIISLISFVLTFFTKNSHKISIESSSL